MDSSTPQPIPTKDATQAPNQPSKPSASETGATQPASKTSRKFDALVARMKKENKVRGKTSHMDEPEKPAPSGKFNHSNNKCFNN